MWNLSVSLSEMCGSQCQGVDKMCDPCYSELAGFLCPLCYPEGVMRKNQTSLTYKTLKQREIFQVIKKIFWGEKSPVRLLYNDVYGTETSPLDEFSYIGICLWEGLNIIGSHYKKKFFGGKKCPTS